MGQQTIKPKVAELKEGQHFPGRITLDKRFVVTDENISFSKTLQRHLIEWNFKEIFCDVDADEIKAKPPVNPEKFEAVDLDLDELNNEFGSKSDALNANLKTVVTKMNQTIKNFPDKNRMENVTTVYNEFLDYTQKVFTRYVTHKEMKIEEISESISLLIDFIKVNHWENCLKVFQ